MAGRTRFFGMHVSTWCRWVASAGRMLGLVFCASVPSISLAHDTPPNFVVMITDDISHDDLACYGNTTVRTPNLDRLAAQGIRFTNAYLTTSSCSPSRVSLITGRYPHNTGACELHTVLPAGHFLFPRALQDAGYHTVLSGKHHMGDNADVAFSVVSDGAEPGKQGDWVDLLKSRPRDKPFFFWFASGDAHRKWTITDDAPRYEPQTIRVPPYLVDGPQTRQDLADYYHEVSRTDAFAGRVAAELAAQGVAPHTYFVYLSDNGRPFPRCKTRLYDSGIKSPLIISRPGTIRPAVTNSLVSVSIDLAATILELAGIQIPDRVQGVSFARTLLDPSLQTRQLVFAEQNWHVMQAHQRMVRRGDYVYIRNAYPERQALCVEGSPRFPAGIELWDYESAGRLMPHQRDIFLIPRPAEELYDVSKDPHQLKNLASDAEFAKQRDTLRADLDAWSQATHDSVPSDPTPDRQDAFGKRVEQWRHRVQPGVEVGSLETNGKGPI